MYSGFHTFLALPLIVGCHADNYDLQKCTIVIRIDSCYYPCLCVIYSESRI